MRSALTTTSSLLTRTSGLVFCNDTATTEIYTLSLHDALPICHIIAVSERLRQFAIALGAEPARVKVIPNGVDTARFFARDRDESRKKYGLPLDRKIVLSVGHLIELKGHHRVIRAVGEARAEGSDADLLIVGGAGDAQSYEPEIRQGMSGPDLERNVRFIGEVP